MRLRKDRKKNLLTQTGYDDLLITNPSEGPERLALNSELRGCLEQGLGMVAPHLRAAVVLRDVQGLNNEEAAAALGISVSSLKARPHRGRVLLRKYLQDYLQQAK
jgi:RNA polymerase sigma-70 factor (ECF subfamily)